MVLGNLLENAIEASEQTENKFLSISLSLEKGVLFLNISNSYRGEVKREGERFISTKENKAEHGYGLENVRRVVEQNNGMINFKYEEGIFNVNVMLYV